MTVAASTELEAINIMLASIGEAPINTLTGTLPVDAKLAQNTLSEINKEVQSEGWSFNTEIDVVLTRDSSNDRKNHTFEFEADLKSTVVFLRDFDEIPEPARRYITIKASRVFVDRLVGDEGLRSFSQQDEVRARAILMETDLENGDHNLLRGDPSLTSVFDTYSPSNALIR